MDLQTASAILVAATTLAQAFGFFILTDIRDRVMRLERLAMGETRGAHGAG